LGIDEAGKGCVIGYMFVVGVALNRDEAEYLRSIGVKDSKLIHPRRRLKLYEEISRIANLIVVEVVSPSQIDVSNLNIILMDRYALIINKAREILGGNLTRAVIDAIYRKEILEKYLHNKVRGDLRIIVEYDADKKFIEVSAASIVAKVLRDKHISLLHEVYGNFGSGYPSDPQTINWIREYFKRKGTLPPIIRRSWKTIKKIAPSYYVDKHRERGKRYSGAVKNGNKFTC